MAYSLRGSAGAVVTGSSGGSITTLAFGQSPTAGNLLILWVAVDGAATAPATPSGWTAAVTKTGTSSASGIFYKIAAGGDAAPTISAITSAVQVARLAEFVGNPSTSPLDKTGSAAGTTSAQAITCSAADAQAGDLVIGCSAIFGTSRSRTLSETINNGGTLTTQSSTGTTTADHYFFSYDLGTTGNSAADSLSLTFTTTSITGVTSAIASFTPAPPPPASWAFVQGVNGGNNGASSLSATLPSNITVGHRLVVWVYTYGSGITLSSLSDSLGNQGATAGQFDQALVQADPYNGHLYCLTAPVTVGGSDTITATASGSASYISMWVGEYSGLSTATGTGATVVDVTKGGNGTWATTGNTTGTSAATANASDMVTAALGNTDLDTFNAVSSPSGWTERFNDTPSASSSTGPIPLVVDEETSGFSGAALSATWTFPTSSSGNGYAAALVAFVPSAGGGGNAYTQSITETVGPAADSVSRTESYARALTETASASDIASRVVGAARSAAETVGPAADAATQATGHPRAATESQTATDTASRLVTAARTVAESHTAADSPATSHGTARAATESATAVDLPMRSVGSQRGASESVGPAADTASSSGNGGQLVIETVGPASDAAVRTFAAHRSLAETVGPAADTPAKTAAHPRAVTETQVASDTVARALTVNRSLAESHTAADVVASVAAHIRALTESVLASDTTTRLLSARRTPTETVGPAADSVSSGGAGQVSINETVGAAVDAAVRVYGAVKTVAETLPAALDALGQLVIHVEGVNENGLSVFAPTIAADTPLAWWRLDETSGTTAADHTGNGYTATIGTGVLLGQPGLTVDGDQSMRFALGNSTTQSVHAALPALGNSWSWEIWFESDTSVPSGGYHYMLTWGTTAAPGLYLNPQNSFVFTPGVNTIGVTGPFNDGQAHHGVITWDGTTLRSYLDGVAGQSTTVPNPASALNLAAGTFYLGSISGNWIGRLDEAAVYNYPLTATQVANHWTAGTHMTPVRPTTDTVSQQYTGTRQAVETVGAAADAVARAFTGQRAVTETHTAADAPAGLTAHPRVQTEAVGPGQATPSGYSGHPRAASESVGPASDQAASGAQHPRGAAEHVLATDSVQRIYSALAMVAEAVGPAYDNETANGSGGASVFENLSHSDTAHRQTTLGRALLESYAASDTAVRTVVAQRMLRESVGPAFDGTRWGPGIPGLDFSTSFRDGAVTTTLRDGQASSAFRDGLVETHVV